MLRNPECTLLVDLLAKHVLRTPNPYVPVAGLMGDDFVDALAVPLNNVPPENARVLVEVVREAGLSGPEPPVLRLLNGLAQHAQIRPLPESRRVQEILDRLRVAHESLLVDGTDAFDMMVLAAQEVFLDRTDLRESLKVIQDDEKPELVLQVAGDPATGKSYTFELIANAAPSYDFSTALVRLDDTGTADDVVEDLAAQLRVADGELPERGSDLAKWYSRVTQRLVIKAADTHRHWWLVIDGLNHLPTTSEVWDLVRRLASNVRWHGEGRVRLALLGYDGALDHELRNRLIEEVVEPVDEEDVRIFFTDWLRRAYPDDTEDALRERVNTSVTQAIAFARDESRAGGCYMRELGRAVEQAIREVHG